MINFQCNNCKHYIAARSCGAFPDGIPEKILLGQHDHRQPFPGDNGIQFEQKNKNKKD